MLRARFTKLPRVVAALAAMALLAVTTPVFGQASTTATVRGTVEDTSGGVLPGATVTLTNAGTGASQIAVTNERGGYLFTGLFPGTYSLRVELEGFRGYEQQNIAISPNDTRGIDVRLEVGALTDTVTVTAVTEVIQTETGAREGVLTAAQIDNLSTVGRSSLELLRILPGVVAPDNTAFESVSFGGGANNTQGYTVNGIRSSNNTVSLDGSALIDIGSNSGLIVTLNNDMVQEVKVQSSNFAAEYGSGGMSISAVTKGGSSRYSGTVYDYWRNYRFAANDRSNSILGQPKPESTFQYPGGNLGGPIILPGTQWNRNRDKAFFFVGLEFQRQQVDPGARLGVVPTELQRQGIFTEFLSPRGQNLDQAVGPVLIPQGFPGAGTPAPGADLRPYIHPLGNVLANAYPLPNYQDPNNRYNYVLSQLEPQNRRDLKMRFDYNVSNNTKAYVRVALEREEVENARGVWWGASEVALPTPNLGSNVGRSYSGNVVSVLSPTMTNEVLVSYSRLRLDNAYKDPSLMRKDTYGVRFDGPFGNDASPYLPGVIPNWGGGVSNLWSAAEDMYAHNDEMTFSNKLTKIAGAHGLKFGGSLQRLQKQQNFQNDQEGYLVFAPSWTPGSTGNAVGDILTGRVTEFRQGTPTPDGEFRMWNLDVFAQDSWKVRPNFTLEFGVRAGYWTNNSELNGLGGWFDPSTYNPNQGQWLDPGTYTRLNGVRTCSTATRPRASSTTAARLRCRASTPRGTSTARATTCSVAATAVLQPQHGQRRVRQHAAAAPGDLLAQPGGLRWLELRQRHGLHYDTLREATLASRLGSVGINTLTPDSFTFPKTHSFSVSYARRIFFNQVAEVSYVGTRGFDLVSRVNLNVVPQGALLQGTVQRGPLEPRPSDGARVGGRQPVPAVPGVPGHHVQFDFEGESQYNSMQLTVSRQTGRRLQYFVAYTLGRTKGTLGDEYRTAIRSTRCAHLRHPLGGPHARPERLVERLPAGWRPRCHGQPVRPRPAERLAGVGHLVGGERCADLAGVRRHRRWRRDRPRLLRHADIVLLTGPGGSRAASRRSTPVTRGSAGRTPARRCSTSTASASRRSARWARCCRRTTSGRRPGRTTT
jgi:hypothetical protein